MPLAQVVSVMWRERLLLSCSRLMVQFSLLNSSSARSMLLTGQSVSPTKMVRKKLVPATTWVLTLVMLSRAK